MKIDLDNFKFGSILFFEGEAVKVIGKPNVAVRDSISNQIVYVDLADLTLSSGKVDESDAS